MIQANNMFILEVLVTYEVQINAWKKNNKMSSHFFCFQRYKIFVKTEVNSDIAT